MKCSICGCEITGYPNNAQPINNGQCCSDCNINIVVPKRIEFMKVLKDAALAQATFTAGMRELNGYETQITFYSDFTIADHFGVDAINDTYKHAFESWKDNIVYLTEFVMVLNHKIWEHHHKNNSALMTTYDTLWKKADEWCMNNLSDEDLEYYLKTTD